MPKRTSRIETYLVGAFMVLMAAAIGGWIWWSSRKFDQPGDRWMTKAWGDARGWADDAELVTLEGTFVRPDGVADLDSSIGGRWHFFFWSPSRAASEAEPAANAVPGAPVPAPVAPYACFAYSVSRGSGRARNLVLDSGVPANCHGRGPGASEPPRCSLQQVWARAKEQGAPDPGYAEIRASVEDGAWRWSFRIEGHIDLELADDC